jgi:hypothetical protein
VKRQFIEKAPELIWGKRRGTLLPRRLAQKGGDPFKPLRVSYL